MSSSIVLVTIFTANWFHHVCAHTWLYPHTFVPPHVWAQTHLCPDKIGPTWLCIFLTVPWHVFAHTRLCPHSLCPNTFVPIQVCAHTRLCQNMFVPKHVCAHIRLYPDKLVPIHELWPHMIMSLVNNNIIIVSTRLWVNLIGQNTSMLSCCWMWNVIIQQLFSNHQHAVFQLEYFVILF